MKKKVDHKSILLLSLAALSLGAIAHLSTDAEFSRLKERGAKVFAFDDAHTGILPNQEVMALSFALAFHDARGADALLQKLEAKLF